VPALAIIAACLLAGSLVYCVLIMLAVRSYLAQRVPADDHPDPISVLKPLSGIDEGLETNLRSFFEQDHPEYEILFAVREAHDPAAGIVTALQREFPSRAAQLIVTGEPPYANAKVFSLDRMLAEARYDLLVMSDSDIRVAPSFLTSIAAEFSDQRVALATCPYRAVAGRSLWSILEAEGMNTEFLAGLLVARMLEGVKFAVGPTVAARKSALAAIGGFNAIKDYLAEDFVLGKFTAEAGFGVILSRNVVEHRIGSQGLRANAAHRLRWARSTRRSRPLGYVGQIFTYPLALALLTCALAPRWWPLLFAALVFRAAAAWCTSVWILGSRPHWLLTPVQDILSFCFWVAGFFGNTIVWRGRRYYLYSDGRFELR
jgi:ceramide glucosyltransferase